MKKILTSILVIILSIAMSLFLFACKSETPVEEEAVEQAVEETPAEEEEEQAVEETPAEEEAEEAAVEEVEEEVIEEEVEVEMYSIGSIMADLLDNPETMEIMQKYIPDIVNSDRIGESRAYALKLVLGFQGVEEDIINQLDEDLQKVEVVQ